MNGAPKHVEKVGVFHAFLRARNLGRVTRKEVKHSLGRRKPSDRRHHTKCVGGEHDKIAGMARLASLRGIRNEVERVSRPRVFGLRLIIEIADARQRIVHDVFKDCPEALGGGVDRGFGIRVQLDRFRVAAALEVKNTGRTPTVLVIADKCALRICRQRRFPVPESPKNTAESPLGPAFAEQCIGMTPC
jgi:hypothetical protein